MTKYWFTCTTTVLYKRSRPIGASAPPSLAEPRRGKTPSASVPLSQRNQDMITKRLYPTLRHFASAEREQGKDMTEQQFISQTIPLVRKTKDAQNQTSHFKNNINVIKTGSMWVSDVGDWSVEENRPMGEAGRRRVSCIFRKLPNVPFYKQCQTLKRVD